MSIITYFVPYLFLFAAMIRVQGQPAGPDVIRVPGGRRVAISLSVLGLVSTSLTICLSVLPSDDETNKPLAVFKVIGMTLLVLAGGALIYVMGKRRQARNLTARLTVVDSTSILENSAE